MSYMAEQDFCSGSIASSQLGTAQVSSSPGNNPRRFLLGYRPGSENLIQMDRERNRFVPNEKHTERNEKRDIDKKKEKEIELEKELRDIREKAKEKEKEKEKEKDKKDKPSKKNSLSYLTDMLKKRSETVEIKKKIHNSEESLFKRNSQASPPSPTAGTEPLRKSVLKKKETGSNLQKNENVSMSPSLSPRNSGSLSKASYFKLPAINGKKELESSDERQELSPQSEDGSESDRQSSLEASPKGYSLVKLVNHFTDPDNPVPSFKRSFLLCFPLFMSSKRLVDVLRKNYGFCKTNQAKLDIDKWKVHLRSILLDWLETYPEDLCAEEATRTSFEKLLKELEINEKDQVYCVFKEKSGANGTGSSFSLSMNMLCQVAPPQEIDLLNTEDIAQQLSLLCHFHFSEIQPRDFTLLAQGKKSTAMTSLLEVYAKIRYFTCLQLMETRDVAGTLEDLVDIADNCFNLQNMCGCMAILSVLMNPPSECPLDHQVPWEVSKKQKEAQTMWKYITSKHVTKVMKKKLTSAAVPHLQFFIDTINDICKRSPPDEGMNMIYFDKYEAISQIAEQLTSLKKLGKYPFSFDYNITNYIINMKPFHEGSVLDVSSMKKPSPVMSKGTTPLGSSPPARMVRNSSSTSLPSTNGSFPSPSMSRSSQQYKTSPFKTKSTETAASKETMKVQILEQCFVLFGPDLISTVNEVIQEEMDKYRLQKDKLWSQDVWLLISSP